MYCASRSERRKLRNVFLQVHTSSCDVGVNFRQALTKPVFHGQVSVRTPDVTFHENPLSGSRFIPCGQRPGVTAVTKGNSQFSQFFFSPSSPQDAPEADKINNVNIGHNVPLISGVGSVLHKRGVSSSMVLKQPETTGA